MGSAGLQRLPLRRQPPTPRQLPPGQASQQQHQPETSQCPEPADGRERRADRALKCSDPKRARWQHAQVAVGGRDLSGAPHLGVRRVRTGTRIPGGRCDGSRGLLGSRSPPGAAAKADDGSTPVQPIARRSDTCVAAGKSVRSGGQPHPLYP